MASLDVNHARNANVVNNCLGASRAETDRVDLEADGLALIDRIENTRAALLLNVDTDLIFTGQASADKSILTDDEHMLCLELLQTCACCTSCGSVSSQETWARLE